MLIRSCCYPACVLPCVCVCAREWLRGEVRVMKCCWSSAFNQLLVWWCGCGCWWCGCECWWCGCGCWWCGCGCCLSLLRCYSTGNLQIFKESTWSPASLCTTPLSSCAVSVCVCVVCGAHAHVLHRKGFQDWTQMKRIHYPRAHSLSDWVGRGWPRILSFFLSFQSSFYLPLAHVTDSHLD